MVSMVEVEMGVFVAAGALAVKLTYYGLASCGASIWSRAMRMGPDCSRKKVSSFIVISKSRRHKLEIESPTYMAPLWRLIYVQ